MRFLRYIAALILLSLPFLGLGALLSLMVSSWVIFPLPMVLLIGFFFWAHGGRTSPPGRPKGEDDDRLTYTMLGEMGEDMESNLVGIQPHMLPSDFTSPQAFDRKIRSYFEAAKAKELLCQKTVVVLPEFIGTWLVICGERPSVGRATTIERAMTALVLTNPLGFLASYLAARGKDRVKDALFRMKARQMASCYHRTFSTLASTYGVTVVAGSIVLPEPNIHRGRLVIGDGPLQNVSVVYGPDGIPHDQVVRKVYPIEAEGAFIKGARLDQIPVFQTPAGRLGVLICADSWYPKPYEVLKEKGVDVVAVPAYLAPNGAWSRVWPGYNGALPPKDVDPAHPGILTEGQAWIRYAMAGRLRLAGAKAGITVFLRGRLWDMGADGANIAVLDDQTTTCPNIDGSALVRVGLKRQVPAEAPKPDKSSATAPAQQADVGKTDGQTEA